MLLRVNNRDGLVFVPQRAWAKAVKELAGWRCVCCGNDKKHLIQAHHIIPRTVAPELGAALENGVSLCCFCHNKAHAEGFSRAKHIPERQRTATNKNHVEDYLDRTVQLILPESVLSLIDCAAAACGEKPTEYIKKAVLQRMGLAEWPTSDE